MLQEKQIQVNGGDAVQFSRIWGCEDFLQVIVSIQDRLQHDVLGVPLQFTRLLNTLLQKVLDGRPLNVLHCSLAVLNESKYRFRATFLFIRIAAAPC